MRNKPTPLICIIIPVYNVEPYLARCLDSVISQTLRDLDIILIDDGSTDRSGAICDEYAARDDRVRVLHTPNQGVSAARNSGILLSMGSPGKYLTFIDSDDWIEPDMCAVLLELITRSGADVVTGGELCEFPDETVSCLQPDAQYDSLTAVKLLLQRKLLTMMHNKLWKKELFLETAFPEGKLYEDLALMYKLYMNCGRIVSTSFAGYHYIQREDSISHHHTVPGLLDYFDAFRERYEVISCTPPYSGDPELHRLTLGDCAGNTLLLWGYVWPGRRELTAEDRSRLMEAARFAREQYPLFGEPGWPAARRMFLPLVRIPAMPSFFLVYLLRRINEKVNPPGKDRFLNT